MHIACGKRWSSPLQRLLTADFSTANPHEFRVLESLHCRFTTVAVGFHDAARAGVMGKTGSQDSSTCDINTRARDVWREFIMSYDILDIYPQELST